jgi:nucleoside-diphosphate-sugar epimerase
MKRILVTGASGFVGTAVVDALVRRGAEVHAVSHRRAGANRQVMWHQADLLAAASAPKVIAAARPDTILHLAWIVEHHSFWTSPLNQDWAEASLTLARAGMEAGIKRFVGVGSCYEYEWPDTENCNETTTPLHPKTPYGIAKNATRQAIESLAAKSGIAFAWARLFFLYGPGEGEKRLVPSLARSLVSGEAAKCSNGRAVRDFMDVRDAGEALAALAISDTAGCFNIATGEAKSVADIARKLADISGRPDLLQIGAIPDRPDEPPRIVADVKRLRTEAGFTPIRSLDEGLCDALRYWKQSHKADKPQ